MESSLFKRECKSGVYSAGPYYWAKTTVESWIYIVYPTIYILITYYMVGLIHGPAHFFFATFVLIVSSNASASVGFFVAAVTPSYPIAASITCILTQFLSIFGGFFMADK